MILPRLQVACNTRRLPADRRSVGRISNPSYEARGDPQRFREQMRIQHGQGVQECDALERCEGIRIRHLLAREHAVNLNAEQVQRLLGEGTRSGSL